MSRFPLVGFSIIAFSLFCFSGFANSSNIYGIHWYGSSSGVGAESIMHNRQGYSLENEYVQNRSDWGPLRARVQAAKNAGFTPIVRLDWVSGQTVPAQWDWNGRFYYAAKCRECVQAIGDLCNIWVIGNEMNMLGEGGIPADWYLTCFCNYDANCCYTQIHSVQPSATVCMGPITPWNSQTDATGPYNHSSERWKNYYWYLVNNAAAVDGFAIHVYGARPDAQPGLHDYDPDPRDDSGYPNWDHGNDVKVDSAWGFSVLQYLMGEIDSLSGNVNKPVFITECNTDTGPAISPDPNSSPRYSYRSGWLQKAFECVDTWNKNHYHKIKALCWFVYSYGFGWSDYAIMTEGRSNPPANLVLARSDYSATTQNKNYVNTASIPDAYVYQVNAGATDPNSTDPNRIVMGNYVGPYESWTGADINWGGGGPLGQADYWVMIQSRVFQADTAGTYNFRTTSDDGSWLVVDGELVVNNSGAHGTVTKQGSKYLVPGRHWVWVKFFEWGGGAYTGYQYQKPGSGTWELIQEYRGLKGNCMEYDLNVAGSDLNSMDMNRIVPSAIVTSMSFSGVAMDYGTGGPGGRSDNFILMKPFLFYAAVPGTYTFRTGSDDGSWLWVDGQIVVYNHGLHGAVWQPGTVNLTPGWHIGFFKMFEYNGGAYAAFDYKPPNADHFEVLFSY